ncbi:MAG TPA: hypothetical protein VMN78_03255 [Longimicrobiales bacterium]|nr:hypothetical protein [Longimicrobiales bacterium]
MIHARRLAALTACLAVAGSSVPLPAVAQENGPAAACGPAAPDAPFCRTVAQGVEALLPALVMAAAGGNPVPGTASTLGMRLTSMPRWSLGGRNTLVWASAPNLRERGGGSTLSVVPLTFAVDGSVGVLPGWNPLPTVGGVASLDILFGAALVPLISTDEYSGTGGWSWAAGARLGLLRESFTLPGISVSAMYRQLRGASLGDKELSTTDSHIAGDLGVFSVRAAASKAILLLNLTGGVGYDLVYGDVDLAYDSGFGAVRVTADGARMERLTVFADASYTLMVLNFVLGAGWQEAPPAVQGTVEGDAYSPSGTFYATAALRLSI